MNAFDIYEVLVDAPKQRSLEFNYFATEKASKVPGSIIWKLLFFFLSLKKFSTFSSFMFGVCVIYSIWVTQKFSQHLHQGPLVCSTWSMNKGFAGCSSSAATSGNVAASGPCFSHQFQSFLFWLLWYFILSEVIFTIFSNESYEEKGKRWEKERDKKK